jgi:vacuolar iron transporter family protein
MSRPHRHHKEKHLVNRIGWLRAAVLGANDGIISTASLIVGVAAAAAKQNDVLIAGVSGLVAGAMSMAAGEYVSVSSQSDSENADLAKERRELRSNPEGELDELAEIYVKRGVEIDLARQVAGQLMKMTLSAPMLATNWGFLRRPPRSLCRQHSRRRLHFPLAQRCRC